MCKKIIKILILIMIVLSVLGFIGCKEQEQIVCINCNNTISYNDKFCPYCGYAIDISDSNKNNNLVSQECNHLFEEWVTIKEPTCTESGTTERICSKCNKIETQSILALGHTTDCGLCSRCSVRTGWTKEEVQSYIKVYSVYISNINSVGGVNMKIGWENTSSKTIKYFYFTVEAYNAVWDKVYCTIRDYNAFTGYSTGPFDPGYTNISYRNYAANDYYEVNNYWENCYYNSSIKHLVLTNVRVIFMDNTEIKIDENNIDYCFADYPSGLFYQWNNDYNGYEVEYRMRYDSTISLITIPSLYNNKPITSIGNNAFYYMKNLKRISLPSTIKRISGSAFRNCTSLQEIEIPNGVTTIESFSFEGCSTLTKVIIPKSVTEIEYGIFEDCDNIEIIYKGTQEDWEKIKKDKYWSYKASINKISYIGDSEFDDSKETDDCYEDGMTVVHVSSGIDFLNSLGNNTKIVIDSESIDLSNISNCVNSNIYKQAYNTGFIVSNINNLIITGNSTILINDRYADVLSFLDCENITLLDLTIGHIIAESEYKCDGAVVKVDSCKNVKISNCDLFGCGAVGLSINNSNNIIIDSCEIFECNFSGISLWYSDIKATNCSVHDCSFYDYGGAIVSHSSTATFDNCVFENISVNILINIDDYSNDSKIDLSSCQFNNNIYIMFSNENNKVKNN